MLKFLETIRVRQWYKNLLVLLPIIFVGELFDVSALLLTFVGFLSLSLVSSSGYIVNDIIDREHDRNNPEKKDKLIASGKLGRPLAFLMASCSILFSCTFLISCGLMICMPPAFSLFLRRLSA